MGTINTLLSALLYGAAGWAIYFVIRAYIKGEPDDE